MISVSSHPFFAVLMMNETIHQYLLIVRIN